MPNFLITPIFFHYNFLEELSREAAEILSLEVDDKEKYQEFKISIFLNFNRYLNDSLLFLPDEQIQDLLAQLTQAMETANEEETLRILNEQFGIFPKTRSEFLDIIKNLNK